MIETCGTPHRANTQDNRLSIKGRFSPGKMSRWTSSMRLNPLWKRFLFKGFPVSSLCLMNMKKSPFQTDKWCIGSTTCLISYIFFVWFWPSVSPGLPAGLLKAFWHFLSSSVASCSRQHRGHCFLTNVEQLTSLLHVAPVTKVKHTLPL